MAPRGVQVVQDRGLGRSGAHVRAGGTQVVVLQVDLAPVGLGDGLGDSRVDRPVVGEGGLPPEARRLIRLRPQLVDAEPQQTVGHVVVVGGVAVPGVDQTQVVRRAGGVDVERASVVAFGNTPVFVG